MDAAAATLPLDPCSEARFQNKELVRVLVGDEKVEIPFQDRDDELKSEMSMWYERLKWWAALKRAGVPLAWGDDVQTSARAHTNVPRSGAAESASNPPPTKRQRVGDAVATDAAQYPDDVGAAFAADGEEEERQVMDDLDGVDW